MMVLDGLHIIVSIDGRIIFSMTNCTMAASILDIVSSNALWASFFVAIFGIKDMSRLLRY